MANVSTASPMNNSQQWLMDSAASHHVTSELGNLAIHSDYEGPDEILIGDGLGHDNLVNTTPSITRVRSSQSQSECSAPLTCDHSPPSSSPPSSTHPSPPLPQSMDTPTTPTSHEPPAVDFHQAPIRTQPMTTCSFNNTFKPKQLYTVAKYPIPPSQEPSCVSEALRDPQW
ncbi:hypothetical protein GH714_030467 [Hevea brasiliensis]|uniref:Uncharacterized protein n=1 Tax=Hevea brasiliensis TaxID=3981 RepID=A0A6A6K7L8_HEVBR|nr:hypothetical protein GH714_030467 [Hevea brasiliensis]